MYNPPLQSALAKADRHLSNVQWEFVPIRLGLIRYHKGGNLHYHVCFFLHDTYASYRLSCKRLQ